MVLLDALLAEINELLPFVLWKLILLVKVLAGPDQVEHVPLLLVEVLLVIPPNVVRWLDKRVSSLVHEIPEAGLISLDHLIFEVYLP